MTKKRQYTAPQLTAVPLTAPQMLAGSEDDSLGHGGQGQQPGYKEGEGGDLAKRRWGYDPTWGQEDNAE